ncbi:MAG: hypothetical protein ACOWWO_06100 [Peptococcaceae bacterium]
MDQEQIWVVDKFHEGMVYFTNKADNLVIPLGLIPGKLAVGDLVRISFSPDGNVTALKVVLKNTTQR